MKRARSITIGVDAGGTKTRVVVQEGDRTLGVHTERGINAATVGAHSASDALIHAVGQACAAVRCQVEQVADLAVGIAGAGTPAIQRALTEALETAFTPAVVLVTSDAEAALAAVGDDPNGGPRAVVIAGTGSIVLARDAAGVTARAGGHGFLLGDEGSAAWIARDAVRGARRAQDGRGPETALAEVFAGRVSPTDAAGFASLYPLVVECAQSGDAVARRLFAAAGLELAIAAEAALRSLELLGKELPLCACGGAFHGSELLRQEFARELGRRAPRARIAQPSTEPEHAVIRLLRARHRVPLR